MPPSNDELQGEISKLRSEINITNNKLDKTNEKLDKIYTALFGVEGTGGLHRWVVGINDKQDRLEKEVTLDRGKFMGIAIGISGFISIIGFLASKLLK